MATTIYLPDGRTIRRSLAGAALILLWSLTTVRAQVFQWAEMGGGQGWKRGNAIAVDALGSSFIVGEFSGSSTTGVPAITFGTTPLSAVGHTDGFIAMYDPNGAHTWVRSIGKAEGNVTVKAIAAAATSGGTALYVTGEFDGTEVDFGGKTASGLPGSSFIAKYIVADPLSPTPPPAEWVAVAGPQTANEGNALTRGIAADGTGTIYVCGSMKRTVTFGGVNSPDEPVVAPGVDNHLFVARYVESGGQVDITWARPSGGPGSAAGNGIAMAGNGGAVVTGHFSGAVEFTDANGLPIPLNGVAGSASDNLLLARYGGNGHVQWAAKGGENSAAPGSMAGRGVAVDPGSGTIYVTGRFSGTVHRGPDLLQTDYRDFFVAKYDGSGNPQPGWKGGAGLTGDAIGNGIAVHTGEPYVTGTFSGRLELGTSSRVTIGSMGNHDIFVIRYGASGDVHWARRAGNIYSGAKPPPYYDQGTGIAVQGDGTTRIVGEFGGEADFFNAPPLWFGHPRNVFLAKLSATATKVTGRELVDGAPQPYGIIKLVNPALDEDYVTTGADGAYTAYLPADDPNETFHVAAMAPRYRTLTSPTAGYHPIPGNGAAATERNFLYTTPPVRYNDLSVTITPQSEGAISGGRVRYLIAYENLGSAEVADVRIELRPDYHLSYLSSTLTPVQTSPEVLWSIPSLGPLQGGTIAVTFTLASMPTGGSLHSEARIGSTSPLFKDTYPDNNTSPVDEEVVQPSDPNGKTPFPQGNLGAYQVRDEQWVTYTVDFFNQGPGIARHVSVTDTLDASFDLTGNPQIVVLSGGPVVPVPTIAARSVVFRFDNANLLPVNESSAGSRGFVTFAVKVMRSAAVTPIGTQVPNVAWVRFFNNDAVLVSTVNTPTAKNCVAPDFKVEGSCLGEPTAFTSRSISSGVDYLLGGTGNYGWRWDFGDGSAQSTDPNPTHLYTRPGTYTVRLTFKDSVTTGAWICGRYDSVLTVVKEVTISPIPTASITRSGATLTANLAASYQWYRNGAAIDGATERTYTMPGPGSYSVRIGNSGGCESFSGTVGAPREALDERGTMIHPNPGTGYFMFELERPAASQWRLSIIDARGGIVLRRTVGAGLSRCGIDLRDHPSGVYTARFEVDGTVVTRSFVLRR